MRCLACKNDVMQKTTNAYFAQLDGRYVIVENVPCYKCEKCGEVFYSASTLETIEKLLSEVRKYSGKLSIVEYRQAA